MLAVLSQKSRAVEWQAQIGGDVLIFTGEVTIKANHLPDHPQASSMISVSIAEGIKQAQDEVARAAAASAGQGVADAGP